MSNTILSGGDGHPPLVIRDQDWRAQAAAEQREKQDEQIRAAVAGIERDANVRRTTARLSAAELAECSTEAKGYVAAAHRQREEPARLSAQMAELEAWAASLPPRPPDNPIAEQAERDRVRWAKANDYSNGLREAMARPHCGHGSCFGRCIYQ